MSRFCGDKPSEPILRAAAHWRDNCLLESKSVLGHDGLWQLPQLKEIDRYFVQRPDLGKGSFLGKLQQQLSPASPESKRLTAEMMWVMYLCPSSLTPRHKVETIHAIWSWSGTAAPGQSEWLDTEVLEGVGSAGPGFNQNQWRELTFFTNCLLLFLALPKGERERLLSDAWSFDTWLKNVPDWRNRQFRHMVLFLLFPDHFERVFGGIDRRVITSVFSGQTRRQIDRLDAFQIDEMLRDIRASLELEYGTKDLDFYISPLKERWRTEAFSTAVDGVTSEHVKQALDEIDLVGIPNDAESSTYDVIYRGNRYPPKLVVSLAAKYATGDELDRATFAGGEGTPAFNLLTGLGFEIEPKDVIRALLERFIAQADEGNTW